MLAQETSGLANETMCSLISSSASGYHTSYHAKQNSLIYIWFIYLRERV
jgi:hypothetical protein